MHARRQAIQQEQEDDVRLSCRLSQIALGNTTRSTLGPHIATLCRSVSMPLIGAGLTEWNVQHAVPHSCASERLAASGCHVSSYGSAS